MWQKKNLCTIALRSKTVAQTFLPFARQCKWPFLSRKIVEIQKFFYHGNVKSQFLSPL